ncbi:hypothetical protein [Microcoleus sp. PH2017_30_WIL_O_A]|uniref:hypothetical protein n=1 Tax=Microcoleus sp. PH2017_30_WIL_O_A TaxID=2798840 RepID=UPI0025EF5671|nr:hypothetical protein [Microcoleus sp. PH2017_30_WIL_O_A]
MNEARRKAYQNLIESILSVSDDYEIAVLQANIELIDDSFSQYVRDWATQTMAKMLAEQAYYPANFLLRLGMNFYSLRQGSRAINLEIAITCMEIGLTIVTREAYSESEGKKPRIWNWRSQLMRHPWKFGLATHFPLNGQGVKIIWRMRTKTESEGKKPRIWNWRSQLVRQL